MRPGLGGKDAVVRPAAGDPTQNTIQALSRQLINVVQHQPVANVVDRVPTIESRKSLVRSEAFAGSGAIGGRRATMPSRSFVDRVAVRVAHVEQQAVTHLVLQRSLQRAVVGVDRVLPVTQATIVLVQAVISGGCTNRAAQPCQCPTEVIGNGLAERQARSRLAVDVFGSEQLMTRCANIVNFYYSLGKDFALQTEIEVVDVWISDPLREDDSCQGSLVRITRIPAVDVAKVLRLRRRPHVPWVAASTEEGWCHKVVLRAIARRRSTSAGGGSIHNICVLNANAADYLVKRIV